MSLENAKQNLKEFGKELNLEGLAFDENKGLAVIVTAIDNLCKGAAGQAIQNMNVMYDFDERDGLR